MNIGVFADCGRPTVSGVVTSVMQLRAGLEQRGHRTFVFTVATPGHEEKDPAIHTFPSVPFNAASGFRLGLVDPRAVVRITREEKLDIIHTHTEYSLGWAGRHAARTLGLPLVHTAHTLHEHYRHYLFGGRLVSARWVQRYLQHFLSGYDVLVCPSRKAQVYFRPFAPSLRTVVVANGIDSDRLRPRRLRDEERELIRRALGIQPQERVILYVGRIAREKRVLDLLQALTPLLQAHTDYKVVFAGSGPCFGRLLAAGEGLPGRVILTGTVDWDRIHGIYGIADVFVTASLSEVHPMTLIEASICGLPIVARRDDSFVDLVRDGYNGYLADSDQQLAERLSEILSDDTKRLTFSRNALALASAFGAAAHVDQVEALYQQLHGGRSLRRCHAVPRL